MKFTIEITSTDVREGAKFLRQMERDAQALAQQGGAWKKRAELLGTIAKALETGKEQQG